MTENTLPAEAEALQAALDARRKARETGDRDAAEAARLAILQAALPAADASPSPYPLASAGMDEALATVEDEGDKAAVIEAVRAWADDNRSAIGAARAASDPGPFPPVGFQWRNPAPAREWLIEGWLPANRFALLAGPAASGKTQVSVTLAAAIASPSTAWMDGKGSPALATAIALPVTVASFEDEEDEFNRRLVRWPLARKAGEGQAPLHGGNRPPSIQAGLRKLLEDRLVFRDLSEANSLWDAEKRQPSAIGNALRDDCEKRGSRLLIVDTLADAFAGNENNRDDVSAFVVSWDRWARLARCAVVFISHPPKAPSRNEEAHPYSGSTAWHGKPRMIWEMRSRPLPDGVKNPEDGSGRAMELSCYKSSYGPRPAPLMLTNWKWWKAQPWPRNGDNGDGKPVGHMP